MIPLCCASSLPVDTRNPIARTHPANRGLLGWWMTLPGTSGGRQWRDLMGLNHGTLNNMTTGLGWKSTTRPGGFGHILSSTAGTSYVDLGASTRIQPTNTGTVAAWINWDGTRTGNVHCIVCNNDIVTTDRNGFALFLYTASSNDALAFELASASASNLTSLTATPKIFANAWRHVAATWNGSSIVLYINGILLNTTSQTVNATAGTYNTYIGRAGISSTNYWPGAIDDVRIYNRALSATEMFNLYNASSMGYPNILNRITPADGMPSSALLEMRRRAA